MEAMLRTAQEQAIRTNYLKHKIDEAAQSPRKAISHIVSECEKLAQKEYKRRKLCGKLNLKRSKK